MSAATAPRGGGVPRALVSLAVAVSLGVLLGPRAGVAIEGPTAPGTAPA